MTRTEFYGWNTEGEATIFAAIPAMEEAGWQVRAIVPLVNSIAVVYER